MPRGRNGVSRTYALCLSILQHLLRDLRQDLRKKTSRRRSRHDQREGQEASRSLLRTKPSPVAVEATKVGFPQLRSGDIPLRSPDKNATPWTRSGRWLLHDASRGRVSSTRPQGVDRLSREIRGMPRRTGLAASHTPRPTGLTPHFPPLHPPPSPSRPSHPSGARVAEEIRMQKISRMSLRSPCRVAPRECVKRPPSPVTYGTFSCPPPSPLSSPVLVKFRGAHTRR